VPDLDGRWGAITEKRQLYFEAGAEEVWLCDANGKMTFYHAGSASPQSGSKLGPEFPKKVELQ
jgi:hypothetical protein